MNGSPNSDSVICLEGVARTYPGTPAVEALAPTTLKIAHGEFISVVGPSGSGKSTLLNVLGLLDEPTEGRYHVSGHDVSTLSDGQRSLARSHLIGFVFQAFHLVNYRTAVENVELSLLYQGVARRTREPLAAAALERVGLAHRLNATPGTLSGGEKQRVAIARAIAARPAVLLCDEPTGNLDTETTAGVMKLLNSLNRAGITIVVITHDPDVASRTHRIIRLRDGAVEEDTAP